MANVGTQTTSEETGEPGQQVVPTDFPVEATFPGETAGSSSQVRVKATSGWIDLQGAKGDAGVPGAQGPAGPGVPVGGTLGQVLVKKTATDYDTQWQTVVAYGTSLPAAPVDGQEAILVDSLTAPTYTWRFRYNAAATSPYKWEFIGGSAFYIEAGTATDNVDLATYSVLGPTFVIPRAGDYEWSLTCTMTVEPNAVGYCTAAISSALASDWEASLYYVPTGLVNATLNLAQTARRESGLAAGASLSLWGRTGVGRVTYGSRSLRVVPVRVS